MFTFSINPPAMPAPMPATSAASTSVFAANLPPAPPVPPAAFFSTFALNPAPVPPPPASPEPEPNHYPQLYPEGPFPVSYNFFRQNIFTKY